jgi:hypothetical protein
LLSQGTGVRCARVLLPLPLPLALPLAVTAVKDEAMRNYICTGPDSHYPVHLVLYLRWGSHTHPFVC